MPKEEEDLVARSATVEEHALAESSRATYEGVLSVYERVLRELGQEPYPLSEDNARRFIEIMRENGKSWSYVNMAIESFVFWCRENHATDITKTVDFRAYKKGLRRVLHAGELPKAKEPVTKEMLLRWVALSDPSEDERHCDVCFAFVLMFFGFLRHAEFQNLEWRDLERRHDGLRVVIRHSKTDQEYAGREFVLPRREDALDPLEWMQWYCIWHHGDATECVWQHSGEWLRAQIKVYCAAIGVEGSKYSCHSFRKGGAHAAFQAGVPDCAIKVHGRWKSEAYQHYTNVSAMEAAERIVPNI